MNHGAPRRQKRARALAGLLASVVALLLAAGCIVGPPAVVRESTDAEPRTAPAAHGDDLVPGHVVVVLAAGTSLDQFLGDHIGGDVELIDTIPELRAAVLGVPVGRELAQIGQLVRDPRVLSWWCRTIRSIRSFSGAYERSGWRPSGKSRLAIQT
jgi:hypothetical protein